MEELKSPEEIIRCLRMCAAACTSCEDSDGVLCSYSGFPGCMCFDALMRDAADLIAAMIYKKG